MNYITQVERNKDNGVVLKVEVGVNGVKLAFIKGKDGRPLEVSRSRGAMVYDQSSLYVPKGHYAGMIRQVAAILREAPRAPKQQELPI